MFIDANWGRILAAVGYSGACFNASDVDLFMQKGQNQALSVNTLSTDPSTFIHIVSKGELFEINEEKASAIFKEAEITVTIDLGCPEKQSFSMWTCDFSHEYVSINADYRT